MPVPELWRSRNIRDAERTFWFLLYYLTLPVWLPMAWFARLMDSWTGCACCDRHREALSKNLQSAQLPSSPSPGFQPVALVAQERCEDCGHTVRVVLSKKTGVLS